jgi:hypothetical protein
VSIGTYNFFFFNYLLELKVAPTFNNFFIYKKTTTLDSYKASKDISIEIGIHINKKYYAREFIFFFD